MDRRDFLSATVAAGAAAAGSPQLTSAQSAARAPFKHRYAPHFGMFREHAGGNDLVAQLQFMASEGFTALEDNSMKTRPVADQERVGAEMARLNMRMGVFVAHTISWNAADLVLADQAKRDKFLSEIRESVDVAKRVNARWMTVVPGHIDLRLHMEYQTANVVETLKRYGEAESVLKQIPDSGSTTAQRILRDSLLRAIPRKAGS